MASSKLCTSLWIYRREHSGAHGNVWADSLTLTTPIIMTEMIGRNDILPTIRNTLMKGEMAIEITIRLRLLYLGETL